LLIAAAVVVAVLLVAEVGTRAIDDHLPPPLLWHSFEAQKKVAQIDRLRRRGGVDVALTGNSMMNVGIDPLVFERDAGGGVTAYNSSLSSAIPRMIEPWMLDVVLPRLHPKLVVIGVTSFEFTDSGTARTAFSDAFMRSDAARQAMGREGVMQRADRWLRGRSAFWAHRFELRKPRNVIDAIRGERPPVAPEVVATTDVGYSSFLNTQTFEARVQGAGLDVGAWTPGRKDPAALEALVRGTQRDGAKVALVSMPITNEYVARHPRGESDYQSFLVALRALGQRTNVPVIEVDVGRDHRWFADEVHLNRTGSEFYTPQLVAALRSAGVLPIR
jgi:hypothetical protein